MSYTSEGVTESERKYQMQLNAEKATTKMQLKSEEKIMKIQADATKAKSPEFQNRLHARNTYMFVTAIFLVAVAALLLLVQLGESNIALALSSFAVGGVSVFAAKKYM